MENIRIENIPVIIWGEKSDKVYIHVHGKMSCKELAAIAEKKDIKPLVLIYQNRDKERTMGILVLLKMPSMI